MKILNRKEAHGRAAARTVQQTIDTSALLACPFCGATPEVKHIGNEFVKKQVCEIACSTFGCFAHQRVGIVNGRGHTYEWAEQKCRKRWNTRQVTTQPVATTRPLKKRTLKSLIDSTVLFPFQLPRISAGELVTSSKRLDVITHNLDEELVVLKRSMKAQDT